MEKRINKYFFLVFGSMLCGTIGGDRFIRGQVGLGILKLLTFGGLCIWYLVDIIIALTKVGNYDQDFEFNNGAWKQ